MDTELRRELILDCSHLRTTDLDLRIIEYAQALSKLTDSPWAPVPRDRKVIDRATEDARELVSDLSDDDAEALDSIAEDALAYLNNTAEDGTGYYIEDNSLFQGWFE